MNIFISFLEGVLLLWHNIMWRKPNELERCLSSQQSSHGFTSGQFLNELMPKIQGSSKRQPRPRASAVDPEQLELISGSFGIEGKGEVLQLSMKEVATQRAGSAFGRVEDVVPFLREVVVDGCSCSSYSESGST